MNENSIEGLKLQVGAHIYVKG